MENMTYEELKKFCNSLDEKQLEKKVILWREGEAISDMDAVTLEADHYQADNDEGCYTLKDAGMDLKEAEEQGLEKVYDKGTPILMENF